MDKETVVETISEIATSGIYSRDAEGLLFEELASFGYEARDSDRIIYFCRKLSALGEPRKLGCALHSLLQDRESLVEFLNDGTVAAACVMAST